MRERVIVVRTPGSRRLVRLEGLSEIRSERQADGTWSFVAEASGGEVLPLVDGVPPLEAEALGDELTRWLSHRGGLVFDVSAWRAEQRQLALAGTDERAWRSTPRRR